MVKTTFTRRKNKKIQKKDILEQLYFTNVGSGAFRGQNALYLSAKELHPQKKISRKDVKEFLASKATYTIFAPNRVKFKRNAFEFGVEAIGDLMEMDHANISTEYWRASGIKYVFLFQDIFSRYVWAIPVKTRETKETVSAMEKVFQECIPTKIYCDKATEYTSSDMLKFTQKLGIHMYFTNSSVKAPHIERLIRTMRTFTQRYLHAHNSYNIIPAVKHWVRQYNDSVHTTTKVKPIDVMTSFDGRKRCWLNQFLYNKGKIRKDRYDLKIGDFVRLNRERALFEKESEYGGWSHAVYKIIRVKKNQHRTKYFVESVDPSAHTYRGGFYKEELQKVKYDATGLFVIDDILKKSGGKQLVKFRGYSTPEWIDQQVVPLSKIFRNIDIQ